MTELRPGLDALVALNQEMASLVRAGIPLELGLKQAAVSWPARFSALAERISDRLSRGETLVEAIRKEGSAVSPAYAAVVEAGLTSGRLSEALEDVAQLGLTVQEVRRQVWLAAIYPIIVCMLAYVLFTGFIGLCVPVWQQTRAALFLEPNWFFQWLAYLHRTLPTWGPLIPILAFLVVICLPMVAALRSSQGVWLQMSNFVWLPGVGIVLRLMHQAQFCRLLAVLLEHEVPAPRAVLLAAESAGESRLKQGASRMTDDLVRGTTWPAAVRTASGFPKFLQDMLIDGERHRALPAVLRVAADVYQHRADAWLEWIRGTMPVFLAAGVSGFVVLIYAIGLFLPMQQFWFELMSVK